MADWQRSGAGATSAIDGQIEPERAKPKSSAGQKGAGYVGRMSNSTDTAEPTPATTAPIRRTRTTPQAAQPPESPRAPSQSIEKKELQQAEVDDDPMALVAHRVVQIKKRGRHFGLLAQVGSIEGDWVWLYRIEAQGIKTFYRLKPTEIVVIGKGRVCSHNPKPDQATREMIEEEAAEDEAGGIEEMTR